MHARSACEAVLRNQPDEPNCLHLLGLIALQMNEVNSAHDLFLQVLKVAPNNPHVYLNLGVTFKAMGDMASAQTAYQNALALNPDLPEAHYNLAAILAEIDQAQSVEAYRRAISLRPDWAEAYNGLGVVLQQQGKLNDAIANYKHAASLKPQWFLPYHNLAETFIAQGEPDLAIEYFRKSIEREPGFPVSHFDLATQLLQHGSFAEGWSEFEWRFNNGGRTPKREGFDVPVWDGSQLDGGTILIWSEQGFGDVIQFVRYAPLVQQRVTNVWLQTDGRLARLMETCSGLSKVVTDEQPNGDFDFQIPLMSLPRIFGTTLDTVPRDVPYLSAPACDHPALAALKASTSRLRIGILWESGASYLNHEWRDCSPADFHRLSKIPEVSLYSLQFGDSKEKLEDYPDLQITDLSSAIGDFATTAAFVDALDLIVTVDTAMAHLAGALGKRVWTLLNHSCDWRWLLDRNDSPWYPTMTLFRQTTFGSWTSVFEEVEQTLCREILDPEGSD